MFRLLRYFSIASLISVVLATVILGALYQRYAVQHLLELGESSNVTLTHIFSNTIWPQFRGFSEEAARLDAGALRLHPDIAQLHQKVLEEMRNTSVIKVKVYAPSGRTLFSTEPEQIGQDKSTNFGFIGALEGRAMSELTHRDTFSAFEQQIENRDVLSSYVPIRRNAGAPIEGVFEIYADVTPLLENITYKQRSVILSVSAVLALLYGILFLIVRRADGIIRRLQHEKQRRTDQQLEHMAYHDAMTGLPNRVLLQDRIRQSLISAERLSNQLAVAFIDLDDFKIINDSLGHHVGDQVLQTVAKRLAACLRKGDTIARVGGDEFVLSLPGIQPNADLPGMVQKLIDATALPIEIAGHKLRITASVGIAIYPDHGQDVETLMRHADMAMYSAKKLGRNQSQIFAEHMDMRAQQRLTMEREMRSAFEQDGFALHYQPIVTIESGASVIVGAEALLRWPNAHGAWISPAEFIPVAEESGLIVALGEWVLRTACAQNKAWQSAGLQPVYIAVNLSARQITQPDLVEVVAGILKETGLDPAYLKLELTESQIMQNVAAATDTLTRLKAMGVRLSIDDFGTGYSSLAYLKRFPIDTLKIDQSFVRDITTDPDDAAISKTIISMAHGMGLTVIAEGVETEGQKSFLSAHHCDEMQGYLFSRPVPTEKFETLLLGITSSASKPGQRSTS
ncbi:MAG: EAL domain-containing protein [Gammaproteobacteria bacterium]|nr:EAL domain-containing protein [Gammaproteobacteria bacterium]